MSDDISRRTREAGAWLDRLDLRGELFQRRSRERAQVDRLARPDRLLRGEHPERRERRLLPPEKLVRLAPDRGDELLEFLRVTHRLLETGPRLPDALRVERQLREVVEDRDLPPGEHGHLLARVS